MSSTLKILLDTSKMSVSLLCECIVYIIINITKTQYLVAGNLGKKPKHRTPEINCRKRYKYLGVKVTNDSNGTQEITNSQPGKCCYTPVKYVTMD